MTGVLALWERCPSKKPKASAMGYRGRSSVEIEEFAPHCRDFSLRVCNPSDLRRSFDGGRLLVSNAFSGLIGGRLYDLCRIYAGRVSWELRAARHRRTYITGCCDWPIVPPRVARCLFRCRNDLEGLLPCVLRPPACGSS